MASKARISGEYRSIFVSLREYLRDEYNKIVAGNEDCRMTLMKSWEAARVSGVKIKRIEKIGNTERSLLIESKFEKMMEKWEANS